MTIATRLHNQPCRGFLRQIIGHYSSSPTIESERRLQHSTISNCREFLHATGIRFVQKIDWIWPASNSFPFAMLLARDLVAQGLAGDRPFVWRDHAGLAIRNRSFSAIVGSVRV